MRPQPILVVIPARDEAPTIAAVVEQTRAAGFDVLVVNDSSRDATATLAAAAGARVLNPVLPLGAWCAMQAGIRYAHRCGYKVVVTMDADGQHQSHELPQLLAPLRCGTANAVIGACPGRGSRARKFAWAFFRKLTGLSLADLTSGFRAYDQRAIEVLAGEEATLLDYQDIGVLLMLRRAGLRVQEVPVSMQLRKNGKSKIFYSWCAVLGYLLKTGLLCLAYWRVGKAKIA